jgi:hypothetical protein
MDSIIHYRRAEAQKKVREFGGMRVYSTAVLSFVLSMFSEKGPS